MKGRRTNGDGKLRQREDGRWECTIMDGYKPDGRRCLKSFYGRTKTEAQKKKNEYLRAKEMGLLVDAEYLFPEWADMWYENHKDNVKPTTQENYKYTLRILKDGFARRKLKDVKAYDIEQFLKKLPQNRIGWSIRLMLATGMRTQELLALEPHHITEDGARITIEQAVVMEKGTAVIGTPKSFDSYRVIPVPVNIRYCARFLRMVNTKFIWEAGKEDMPCNPSYFRKQFREALEQIEGVRVLTPHCCRHTYVSLAT